MTRLSENIDLVAVAVVAAALLFGLFFAISHNLA